MKADGVAASPAARRTNLEPEQRREFLKLLGFAAAGSAAVLSQPLSLSASEADNWNLAGVDAELGLMLASIARLLFPHPELNDSVYVQVVRDIDADMGQRPDLAKLLQNTAATLEQQVGGDWLAASVPEQVQALKSIEGGEAFFYLRNRTIESLYRNPVVWQLVGYEGSSIEYGGYSNRGFDDIGWLDS